MESLGSCAAGCGGCGNGGRDSGGTAGTLRKPAETKRTSSWRMTSLSLGFSATRLLPSWADKGNSAPMENMTRRWTKSSGTAGRDLASAAIKASMFGLISLCRTGCKKAGGMNRLRASKAWKWGWFSPSKNGGRNRQSTIFSTGKGFPRLAASASSQEPQPLRVGGPETAHERLDVKRLLRAVVIGGGAQVDLGLIGQRPHPHAVVAMLGKQLFGGVQQPPGRFAAVVGRRRRFSIHT